MIFAVIVREQGLTQRVTQRIGERCRDSKAGEEETRSEGCIIKLAISMRNCFLIPLNFMKCFMKGA